MDHDEARISCSNLEGARSRGGDTLAPPEHLLGGAFRQVKGDDILKMLAASRSALAQAQGEERGHSAPVQFAGLRKWQQQRFRRLRRSLLGTRINVAAKSLTYPNPANNAPSPIPAGHKATVQIEGRCSQAGETPSVLAHLSLNAQSEAESKPASFCVSAATPELVVSVALPMQQHRDAQPTKTTTAAAAVAALNGTGTRAVGGNSDEHCIRFESEPLPTRALLQAMASSIAAHQPHVLALQLQCSSPQLVSAPSRRRTSTARSAASPHQVG